MLMWMRQQPAMAEIAKDTGFAQFYAENTIHAFTQGRGIE